MKRVLIAGASGSLGFRTLQMAKQEGFWVRTLTRKRWNAPKVSIFSDDLWLRDATNRQAIRGVCQGVGTVVSFLGASINMQGDDKRSYRQVDFEANRNLLEDAIEAKVPRFVYISVVGCKRTESTAYVREHRRFEKLLRESGIGYTIIRFTSAFSSFDSIVRRAQSGSVALIGRGDARTNPIHPADIARIVAENIIRGPEVIEAGGPELLTRRAICQQIFDHTGTEPSLYRVPAFLLRITGELTRPFNPRKANLMQFLPAASSSDAIAPIAGSLNLADYLSEADGSRQYLRTGENISRVA